jgi:hypothetical protein
MKYVSPIIADARNKIGGSVFARNRAGVYARALVAPVQPRTPSQQANRAIFASLTSAWKTLSAANRASWNTLAPSIILKDSLGQSYMPSGLQLYISCNRNLLQAGQSQIAHAPAGRPSFPDMRSQSLDILILEGSFDHADWIFNTGTLFSGYTFVMRASKGFSPGVTFIGPANMRALSQDINNGDGDIEFSAAYTEVFPVPAVGSNLQVEGYLVHNASGFASTQISQQGIVQG